MLPFLPGRELSRLFYEEAVRPLLEEHFSNLPYAAAHLGKGSDVIGLDTEMSTDHGWGPSVHILLKEEDGQLTESIREMLRRRLPHTFYGYPVNFTESPIDPGTYVMQMSTDGIVNHHIFAMTVRDFFWYHLAYNIDHPPDVADWLTFPSQILREVTAGAVHYDGVGEVTAVRKRLEWYPHDVWLYLLASSWQRIG
jgi:hypothetical protein